VPSSRNELFPVPIQPGLREDVNRELVPVGGLITAQNVRFRRQGEVTPRAGSEAIRSQTATNSYAIANGEAIGVVAKLGDTPLLGSGGHMFGRDATSGYFGFLGCYSSAKPVRRRPALPSNGQAPIGDTRWAVAVNADGYLLFATSAGANVNWALESPEGVRLWTGTEAGTKVVVFALGSFFMLVVQNATTVTATRISVSGGTVSFGTPTVVATLNSAASYWDAAAYSTSGLWMIVAQTGAAVVMLGALSSTPAGAFATTFACTGTVPLSVYCDEANVRVWVGVYDNPTVTGAVNWRVYDATGPFVLVQNGTIQSAANVFGPPLFGPHPTNSNAVFFVHRHSNDSVSPYTRSVRPGTVDIFGTTTMFVACWHVYPLSKPDAKMRVWCMTSSEASNWSFQRTVLLRWRPDNSATFNTTPVLELATDETEQPNVANLVSRRYDCFSSVAVGASSSYFMTQVLLQRAQNAQPNDLIRLDLLEYTTSTQSAHRESQEFGDQLVVAGQPTQFFGPGSAFYGNALVSGQSQPVGAAELGFAYRPAVSTAVQGAGGALTALSTYTWMFVFEWSDALNRRHRSAPSAPISVTLTGGNATVVFQVSTAEFTQRWAPGQLNQVRLVAYRSLVGGTTFYRETLPSSAPNAVDTTDGLATYTSGDTSHSDVLIRTNEVLYTDGGVRDNALAPSGQFLCRSEERLWVGGLWDPQLITSSKIIVPGEPIQFSDSAAFSVVLPDRCTGLAYQDGAVIAFCASAVYAITGDGPNDQGVGQWSAPRALSREIGCSNNRSVLETAQGVMFQNARGWWLLPRGLGQPVYIGAPVQSSGNGTCLGAALSLASGSRLARFLTSTGVVVYNLELGVWHVDTYAQSLSTLGAWPSGVFLALSSLSSSYCGYLESSLYGRDAEGGTPEVITSIIETGALRPWGFAGSGRIRSVLAVHGAVSGSVSMQLRVYGDAGDLLSPTVSWSPTAGTDAAYKQLVPQQGCCTSFRIYLNMQRTSGSGSVAVNGFQVNVSAADGERRTTQTER
jgi:hypothetical protein